MLRSSTSAHFVLIESRYNCKTANMSAFTSIELGKDPKELQAGELSLQKKPLLFSILDGCETLKALVAKTKITSDHIASAKGLILMSANKVCCFYISSRLCYQL
jgi:hypothetical protein